MWLTKASSPQHEPQLQVLRVHWPYFCQLLILSSSQPEEANARVTILQWLLCSPPDGTLGWDGLTATFFPGLQAPAETDGQAEPSSHRELNARFKVIESSMAGAFGTWCSHNQQVKSWAPLWHRSKSTHSEMVWLLKASLPLAGKPSLNNTRRKFTRNVIIMTI